MDRSSRRFHYPRVTGNHAMQGNLHAAIEQLELAKQAGGSFYQLSMIESDLRELREMMGAPGKK